MRFITLIIAITLFPLTINAKNKKELSFKEIETGFLQIPEDTSNSCILVLDFGQPVRRRNYPGSGSHEKGRNQQSLYRQHRSG